MGVAPVGSQKYFTFNGETSKKYNTHITGQGVFNAPVRAVEMVNIPNRNGAFALDQGYFENVELTYKASIAADTATEFSQAVSDLRNWLCSKKGYCRLEDEYNPNEYRMAVYKSGLEVEPFLITSGTFDIVFDCKPQRFLTSGETAVSVANNGTITNPTLFDAKPQLQVKGYGTIGIGGSEIVVENVPVGLINVGNGIVRTGSGNITYSQTLHLSDVLTGDYIYSNGKIVDYKLTITNVAGPYTAFSITNVSNCSATVTYTNYNAVISVTMKDCTYQKGTSLTEEATVDFSFTHNGTTTTGILTIRTVYSGSSTLNHYVGCTSYSYIGRSFSMNVPDAYADSTKTATGNPLYIDLDIGEAWNEDSGTPLSLNNAVQLPSELPVLPSGATTITYDNTITSFKVLPRWWKV